MNKERRKALSDAVGLLSDASAKVESAKEIIEMCRDDEQDAYDNLPESMQDGERGSAMQDNIDDLDGVYYEIDSASETLSEQIGAIQEVIDR